MTTIQISLPDDLAEEARRAGLLSPEGFERWLREQIKTRHVDDLFAAMDNMAATEGPDRMSPEEMAEEIAALRAERGTKARS